MYPLNSTRVIRLGSVNLGLAEKLPASSSLKELPSVATEQVMTLMVPDRAWYETSATTRNLDALKPLPL